MSKRSSTEWIPMALVGVQDKRHVETLKGAQIFSET